MEDPTSSFEKRSPGIARLVVPAILIVAVVVPLVAFVLPRLTWSADFGASTAANTASTAASTAPTPRAAGALTSSGEVISDSLAVTGPMSVEASMPTIGGTTADQSTQPTDWLVYTNQQFGFSIAYPKVYSILEESAARANIPDLVHQVRFQDKARASGDTANLEPAAFTVDVFANSSGTPLQQWLDANAPAGNAARTHVTLGGLPGYKLSLDTYVAPGQFYYVARGNYVYRLTPLGQYGEEMLKSFKLSAS